MKYCPNCGKELHEGAEVCLKCGKLVNGKAYKQTISGQKSRLIAGLLGIFLGGWGIHNFYLGNSNKGVTQIIVTIITCGVGALWGFIEGILILAGSINTDADGNPLGD